MESRNVPGQPQVVTLGSGAATDGSPAIELQPWWCIFERSGLGFAIGAQDATFVAMNPAFAEMHGYSVEELVGKPIATVLTPERVELVCVDALHLLEGNPKEVETEWLDTKVIWEIEQQSEKTIIRFEHDGLTPNLLCYAICEAGWDLFFVDSLKAYLDTGIGKPFQAG